MKTYTHVRDLIQGTSHEIVTVSAKATAAECASTMVENRVGCVIVQNNDELLGIVTAHDLVGGLASKRETLVDTPVSELMSQHIVTTTENKELEEVEALMRKEHIHYLPVLDGRKVVGVVTLADVLALHLNKEEAVESELENYIYGVTRPRF